MAVNVLANLRSHMEYNMLVQKIKDCADVQELDHKKKFFGDAKAAVKQMNTGATKSAQKVSGHLDNKARAVSRASKANLSTAEKEAVKDHVCNS